MNTVEKNPIQRILITPGEPAGIGPDITLALSTQAWPAELVIVADPQLLADRAKQLGIEVRLTECDLHSSPQAHVPGSLKFLPVILNAPVKAGILNPANAAYVLQTLKTAASICQQKIAHAIVTGPVNKAVINQAGITFSGHTEFFAEYCQVAHTVMLFVTDSLKVALTTTHLPLSQVAAAITKDKLKQTLILLRQSLMTLFDLSSPRILVCGLNPHAGESGYLGEEEIKIMNPVIQAFNAQHGHIEGPLPADTIFTPPYLQRADAILAMYHDQALPIVKYLGFGHAVNITLGLPFLRTSVDHGTALDLAGTGQAEASSLAKAVEFAITTHKC
jgi:4-hydroxythreonine-4-phosphate dehydrogenase